jgi:phosphoglycerate-specific signal transduction histidine kinase
MIKEQARNLFQLQTQLIDSKVNMAVSNAIDRVVEQISSLNTEINGLRREMHTEISGLKYEMNNRFSSLDSRVIAVETKLGMVNETEKEIRAKFYDTQKHVRNNFIDYSFKAGWLLLGTVLTYVLYQFHGLIR